MYTVVEGKYLVRLARRTIEGYLAGARRLEAKDPPAVLRERAGVFVTLNAYPARRLRGCIGYPEPVMPLLEATMRAAIAAATQDHRFPPLEEGELDETGIEVTVLTPPVPVQVEPQDYPRQFEIGPHGLIIEQGPYRGLLLPQVAVEAGWGKEKFLDHTCVKAGLEPGAWRDPGTRLYTFAGRVFSEERPKGEVVEKRPNSSCPGP